MDGERDNRSDFGGDGRRRPRPLQATYRPPGDTEGATWNGLLPRKRIRTEEGEWTALDLRAAFARHYFRMPADEDDSAAGEDEGEGTDNDDDNNDNQEVDNPRLKQLSDEAAKYRRKMNEWRKRAEEAEAKAGDTETVRTLRLELSFERLATRAKITDIEAAWRLLEDDLKAVNINDEGAVDAERMQQIVDHVVERYPYLRDAYAPQKDAEGYPSSSPIDGSANATSGRPVNGRRRSDAGTDFGALAKKFPALTRR